MNEALFLLLWLATRLLLLQDTRLSPTAQAWMSTLQIAAAFISFGFSNSAIVLGFFAAVGLILHEQSDDSHRLPIRLAVLFAVPLLVYLLPEAQPLQALIQFDAANYPALEEIIWLTVGFLLVANEANLIIRHVFQTFNLAPLLPQASPETAAADKPAPIDEREYNAGRIIGILERWLIYLLVATGGGYTVIAIIIAAKGFARFQQMDQREFAEYVLIGTLGSTLLAVLVAKLIGLPMQY